MKNQILGNLNWVIPIVGLGFIFLWFKFAYFTIKVLRGVKKALGSEYYLLPNKWPNVQSNPDVCRVIEESQELSSLNEKKLKAFRVLAIYTVCILIVIIISVFYSLMET